MQAAGGWAPVTSIGGRAHRVARGRQERQEASISTAVSERALNGQGSPWMDNPGAASSVVEFVFRPSDARPWSVIVEATGLSFRTVVAGFPGRLRRESKRCQNAGHRSQLVSSSTERIPLSRPSNPCASSSTPAGYLRAATPAAAIWPSCAEVTPETPMAPTIFPPTMSGMPPSIGRTPGAFKTRRPSPPAATVS